MRILFCGNAPIVQYLGASKVLIELADEMEQLGWEADIVGPDSLGSDQENYSAALRDYLIANADRYDVVDYDHETLPFPREEFSSRPLFVARSVLLVHHLACVSMPHLGGLRPALGRLLYSRRRQADLLARVERAQRTIGQADLVNVSNHHDHATLTARGIAPEKVVVLPFGMNEGRRDLFDHVSHLVPAQPTVSFVGTFDPRKGGPDFPTIVQVVSRSVKDVRFMLLGTRGLLPTASDVLRQFPRRIRTRLEVHERFEPEELPYLLSDSSVGIFPSYVEGFGFGVLEMLAASLPVIAYDAPGPPMMLPPDWLVPRGDAAALGASVVRLLQDRELLGAERTRAKELSRRFSWSGVARATSDAYVRALSGRSGRQAGCARSA